MPAARRKTLVGDLTPKLEVYKISLLSCKSAVFSNIPSVYYYLVHTATGKSLSEALIFVSTYPQHDNRLFIELQVQYMTIPSLEHVVCKN